MAESVSPTTLADMLKELYPDGAPPEIVFKKSPFLSLIAKDPTFEGEIKKLPVIHGDPQGRSATFSTAQSNTTGGKQVAFDLDIVNDYGVCQVTGEAIDRAKGKRGALVRALKVAMDGTLRQVTRSVQHAIFRNGGGAIGQVGSYTATQTVLTLKDIRDHVFFEVGQVIAADTTDGTSGAVHAGTAVLAGLNRATGVLTASAAWDTGIAAIAANDYLFVSGDFGIKMSGLDAWLPSSAPGSTAFFGVDRSVDTERLGGVRYDGSSDPLEECLLDGVERVCEAGGDPDVVIVHPRQFINLSKSLGSRCVYSRKDAAIKDSTGATIGFRSIVIDGPNGPVDIVSDINCQSAVGWCLQSDTWELTSCGDVPKMLDDDGMPYLRQATSDGIELRVVARSQIGCTAPGWNGRLTLPSL